MHATSHRGWQLRQMEIPGQPVLLESLAQVAERASQGALQLLQLADLTPGGLPALGRRLTERAPLGRPAASPMTTDTIGTGSRPVSPITPASAAAVCAGSLPGPESSPGVSTRAITGSSR